MTPDEIAVIREWTGDEPNDPALEAIRLRVTSVLGVALSVLRSRRTVLLDTGPAKRGVDGEVNEDWSLNLKALDADIAALTRLVGAEDAGIATTPGVATAGVLVRCDQPSRSWR